MATSQPVAVEIRKQFEAAGFTVGEATGRPGTLEIRKYTCVHYLARQPDGTWALSGPPYFVVRGLNCELEDRGYQKFWYHEGQRFPIRKTDLETLHRFDEEARAILGVKSLYHESLGTTSARSVYDRLTGRPE